jgi:glycosyltransferase involved in cell wall biosynthesis
MDARSNNNIFTMRIAFIWQGSSKPEIFSHWNDGLRTAMRSVENFHEVVYREPWDNLDDVDLILYWESPCTANDNKNGTHYNRIRKMDKKKILLFAGGPINLIDAIGFDLYLVESKINEDEFLSIGLPFRRAFGVNTNIFKPMNEEKIWDGIHHAASASWKRQHLMAEALKEKCLVVGREQSNDHMTFVRSRELGALVIPEQPYEEVAKLINRSHFLIQTAEFWGGGQRATLEAMACGVPVICMEDSPKNREYVEESGFGMVVYPHPDAIRDAVKFLKEHPLPPKQGTEYVRSKWKHTHYASNILSAIESIA